MSGGSFDQGLLHMTAWLGNGIMPLLAGLMIAMGIYKFAKGGDFERYFWGAMASLCVSGLLGLAMAFTAQGTGASQIDQAVLGLTNWICNVILPVYASLEVVRAVLGVSGIGSRLNIGDDWMRHVVAAFAALSCSGLLRLFEHFITVGTAGIA